ncbi:polysaccharide export protein [Sphingomonas sp. LB-2]|uniref:polysaccharide biosynthesis/export family protein n=1 Tax=Sphingomonas caeni TaxID=2984949 RepID=UPI00222FC877|nr:polysaccharide biosynthesis/export family protein [Sphingomonas caeni]MCW3848493.1 polysaccharide export protein [Sphingomonas caeni]
MPIAISRLPALCAALAAGALLLSGCAQRPLNLPSGADAYAIFPPGTAQPPLQDYLIGPSDTISVTVFNEPDFSSPTLRVDVGGNINIALVGRVHAAGKSTDQLGREVGDALRSGGYLVNPRVTVNLVEAVSQRVTVDGEVVQPGIYPLTGPTTLLDAIAMSRGTTRTARVTEVAVFRVINGEQRAAKFDLAAIRRGEAPNPVLQGNDVVVVGFNRLSGFWRDFLQSAPVFALFLRPFG